MNNHITIQRQLLCCLFRENRSMNRENFQSRLGFILVSAGCAIGIGNVWRFPYVAGQNGGGVFVLFYLIFLLCMGVPVLTMELAVGRAGKKSAVQAYKALEKDGQKWHIHGWFCMIGCVLLMMYYTTVSGWMLSYFVKFITGSFKSGMDADAVGGAFSNLLANPVEMAVFMAITVVAGFIVCSFGLQNGLERISKIMMSALLVLIIVLAVHSLVLPGSGEGLRFYLLPDFKRAADVGIGKVITEAMNQAFFTLSLGIGAMEIFGSYMPNGRTLTGESVRICGLDTFVALMSGLIIFPACFTFNVDQTSGPSLIFITLPNIFNHIPLGRLWGSLFFIFMSFAAFSTILAVFENIISCGMELTGWSRKKSSLVNAIAIILLSLPCVLGYNVWSWDWLKVFGGAILDLEDFLVSNILLPLGSLVYLLFCVSKRGWGWENFTEEANTGKGLKIRKWMRGYITYILPLIILFIFFFGLYDKFFA